MQAPDRHELNAGWTLPAGYDVDRLVLLPRDPHKLFAYWEITPRLEHYMRSVYQNNWESGKTIIKLTNLQTNLTRQTDIMPETSNWYFEHLEADHTFRAVLGRILSCGTFITLAVSNTVQTPRDSLSSVIDPRWRMFAFWQHRYYRRMLGGFSSAEFCCGTPDYSSEGGLR